ncbi:MAG: hypothetical protein N3I35_07905 [Clostridia bacterium]|nr:hypothetical protein [Clostridia bacterium]
MGSRKMKKMLAVMLVLCVISGICMPASFAEGVATSVASNLLGADVAQMMFNTMKSALKEKEISLAVKNQITAWKTLADVPANFWAYNYMRAYYNYFNKEKRNAIITRQEFAIAMIGSKRLDYNAKGKVFAKDPYLFSSAPINSFADKGEVTDIFKYFVELALEKNVLNGVEKDGKKYLYPARAITKEEALQLLANVSACNENNFIPSSTKIAAPRITATKRDVKVGILIFDSTQFANNQTDANPDYTLFYALDRNINKPMDWNLINPHNPAGTSKSDANGLDTNAADQSESRKAKFRYWEVKLSERSADELANDYDVLFQTSHKTITMSNADKEKIQNFINKGGQMWWENCDGLVVNNNFVSYGFANNNYIDSTNRIRYDQIPDDINSIHPLLDNIYRVNTDIVTSGTNYSPTHTEVTKLGDLNEYKKRTAYITNVKRTQNEVVVVKNINPSNKAQDLPSIICSTLGNGRLIVSANDIACGICDIVNGGGNGVEDYKFSYNLIGWMSKVAVDFGEMEGKTWENINPTEISLVATVTNLGGKMKDYMLTPVVGNGWNLIPSTSYIVDNKTLIENYGQEVIGFSGYPKIIRLASNESVNITYTLKVNGEMKENTEYKFEIQAKAQGDQRDTDKSEYKLSVANVPLNPPILSYDPINEQVDSRTDYCLKTYVDVEIPSPLSDDSIVSPPIDTYEMYIDLYRLNLDGSNKRQLVPEKIIAGNLKSQASSIGEKDYKILVSDSLLSTEGLTGVTTESYIEGSRLKIIARNVQFSKSGQTLKLRIDLARLINGYKYEVSAYTRRLRDNKTSETNDELKPKVRFDINYGYNNPAISKLEEFNWTVNSVKIELSYSIPQYSDIYSLGKAESNRIEVYRTNGELETIVDSTNLIKETEGTINGTWLTKALDSRYKYYARIITSSSALDQTRNAELIAFVPLHDPRFTLDAGTTEVDSAEDYCVESFIDVNIPSPMVSNNASAPNDTYEIFFDIYGMNLDGSDIQTINALTVNDISSIQSQAAEISKNDNKIIAKCINFEGIDDVTLTTSIEGNRLKVTASNVQFSSVDENLKLHVKLARLINGKKYEIKAYMKRLSDEAVTTCIDALKPRASFIVNYKYEEPGITRVQHLDKTDTSVKLAVDYTIPEYSDLYTAFKAESNRIEVYKVDSDGAETVVDSENLQKSTAGRVTGTWTSDTLPLLTAESNYHVRLTVTSTALDEVKNISNTVLLNLKAPELSMSAGNIEVDCTNDYCIKTYFDVRIPSPIEAGMIGAGMDTYELYIDLYRMNASGADRKSLKPVIISDSGSLKSQAGEINKEELEVLAKAISVEGLDGIVVTNTADGSKLKITLSNVRFTNSTQMLKIRVKLGRLINLHKYEVKAYLKRVSDGALTSMNDALKPKVSYNVNFGYSLPTIKKVREIERSGDRVKVQIQFVMPKYSDIYSSSSQNSKVVIYGTNNSGETIELDSENIYIGNSKINSTWIPDGNGNITGTWITDQLLVNKKVTAAIMLKSTALDTEGTSTIILYYTVDIN